ncbi:MAG: hypothetical protein QOH42_2181, partial [Blastocatellia bacterium]|nr:hypothetical protein [Blastocatellia bacterium]
TEAATLGWRPQSLWDITEDSRCQMTAILLLLRQSLGGRIVFVLLGSINISLLRSEDLFAA